MCRSATTRSSTWSSARDVAQKFNSDYGVQGFFPLPEPVITGPATRVMSLRDGAKKMSKSDESDNSRINLTDSADTIAQKIRKAKTDPNPIPANKNEMKGRPEAENLINIYAALADDSPERVMNEFGGQQFSTFKNALADLTVTKIAPIADEMRRLMADQAEIDRILRASAEIARARARPIVQEVKKIVGFVT
jgi:tryptophanyl-tRNA synthetase